MNYQAAMFYLTLVMTIVNIIIGITVWWTNRDKITNTRFKEVEDRMTKAETTLASLSGAGKKADDAAKALMEMKQALNQSLAGLKNSMTKAIADLRVEFDRKDTCGNHKRMEDHDTEIFQTLRQLHKDLGELVGEVKGMARGLDLVNEHLLNGGK